MSMPHDQIVYATKDDVIALSHQIDIKFDTLINHIDSRFNSIDSRLNNMEIRLDKVEIKLWTLWAPLTGIFGAAIAILIKIFV